MGTAVIRGGRGLKWRALGGALALLLSSMAFAETPTQTGGPAEYSPLPAKLSLQDAINLFKQRGFDLLIADAAVRSAEGGVAIAGQFANPQFSVGYGRSFGDLPEGPGVSPNFFTAGVSDSGVLLDSLFIGKRRLRQDVAEAALAAARLGRADAERTLVATLKQQYVQAVAASAALEIAKQVQDSMQQTEHLVQVRFNAGAISEADLAQAKTATLEAAQAVEVATQQLEQAKVGLAFLLGMRSGTPQFDIDPNLFQGQPGQELQTATAEALQEQAREHRPDVQAEQKQVERARANIALTHRQVVPDMALGVVYSQQGSGPNAITPPTFAVDLTFTPPLFYRLQGEKTQAEADLQTQEVTLAKLQAQVVSDVNASYTAFSAARRRLDRLNNGLLQQAALARDLTRIQYEKGAASLVELLTAQRAYVTVNGEHIQALNDFWTAVFQLEAAIGREFRS